MPLTRSIRSFLYVPADRTDRVSKALGAGADAVLVDLEDAVAPAAKEAARAAVTELLASLTDDSPVVWLRINAGDSGVADLEAIGAHAHRLGGLVLAKCETVAWVDAVADHVAATVALSPLIESALAIHHLDSLAAHPRVTQCHLGEIDLLADLGVRPAAASSVLTHARIELVLASAAAGIEPPIGGVHADVRDGDGLAASSATLADLGFGGRPAIHPSQITAINAAFTPSSEEVEAAARLVARYDEAIGRGVGAITGDDGTMLDEAVVRRARGTLERATGGSEEAS